MRLENKSKYHPRDPPKLYYDPSLRSLTLVVEGERHILNNNPSVNMNLYRRPEKLIPLKDNLYLLRNTDLLTATIKAVRAVNESKLEAQFFRCVEELKIY